MFSFNLVALTTFVFILATQAQYTIDPSTVPIGTRDLWCTYQQSSCPLICTQLPGVTSTTTDANSCNATDLSYSCICENGASPNASEYSQTIPFFICQTWGTQCVAACNGVTSCQSACVQDHPCGAQNPVMVNLTSSTTSSTTGAAVSSATSPVHPVLGSESNNGVGALRFGQSCGLAVVFGGLFAGFTLMG